MRKSTEENTSGPGVIDPFTSVSLYCAVCKQLWLECSKLYRLHMVTIFPIHVQNIERQETLHMSNVELYFGNLGFLSSERPWISWWRIASMCPSRPLSFLMETGEISNSSFLSLALMKINSQLQTSLSSPSITGIRAAESTSQLCVLASGNRRRTKGRQSRDKVLAQLWMEGEHVIRCGKGKRISTYLQVALSAHSPASRKEINSKLDSKISLRPGSPCPPSAPYKKA